MLCVVLVCKWGIVVMSVLLCRFCLNMRVVGDFFCSELGQGTTGCSGGVV